ncbi:hypothetical protein O181_057406 [Austropuccinia psidii MF-1]|uniref:Uncharacterized protein n=1 Tax=Austropuccinia psidii MF-1 TaxID=1389203 RepID=A0A9Q3HTW2_9BASI|nr:hypothetical protein [Austropuccinia psidii MF-1]
MLATKPQGRREIPWISSNTTYQQEHSTTTPTRRTSLQCQEPPTLIMTNSNLHRCLWNPPQILSAVKDVWKKRIHTHLPQTDPHQMTSHGPTTLHATSVQQPTNNNQHIPPRPRPYMPSKTPIHDTRMARS